MLNSNCQTQCHW